MLNKGKTHLLTLNLFLAHLSRMLIGELLLYQWSGVRHPSIRLSTFSNIFFSKTACPIKAKFLCGASLGRGTKVCLHHLGHMMAATPIYGKNPSKIFSRTGRPIFTKLGTPQLLYNTSVKVQANFCVSYPNRVITRVTYMYSYTYRKMTNWGPTLIRVISKTVL